MEQVKSNISFSTKLLRCIALWMVCMYGLAYDQVELPRALYTYPSYALAFVYMIVSFKHGSTAHVGDLVLPFIYFFVNFFWSIFSDVGEVRLNFLLFIILCQLLLLDRDSKIWVFKGFRIFIILMSVLGIICYVSFVLNLGLPYIIQNYYSTESQSLYINYHISYVQCSSNEAYPRLCGLFNEPGYLGTVAALILIVERLNLKRIGNILIFVAACFTFSFAFWVLIILYLTIRCFRKPIYGFLAVAVLLSALGLVQNVETGNESVNKLVGRFSFSNDQKLKGDNRTSERFDRYYKEFDEKGELVFGKGPDAKKKYNITGTAGYKTVIFSYGYIGFLILWGGIIVLSLRKARGNLHCVVFVLLFMINTYQRADIFTPDYFCILFFGIEYIKLKTKHLSSCKKNVPNSLFLE